MPTGLVALLAIFGLPGLALVVNVAHIDDRLAAFSRPFPQWLKGIGADYPVVYRVMGVLWLVVLAVVAIAFAFGRP